jgi:hypothetical protein
VVLPCGKDHDGMNNIMKIKVTKTRVVADDDHVPRSFGDDENDQRNDNTLSTSPVQKRKITDEVTMGPTKKSGLYVMCHDGSFWSCCKSNHHAANPCRPASLKVDI